MNQNGGIEGDSLQEGPKTSRPKASFASIRCLNDPTNIDCMDQGATFSAGRDRVSFVAEAKITKHRFGKNSPDNHSNNNKSLPPTAPTVDDKRVALPRCEADGDLNNDREREALRPNIILRANTEQTGMEYDGDFKDCSQCDDERGTAEDHDDDEMEDDEEHRFLEYTSDGWRRGISSGLPVEAIAQDINRTDRRATLASDRKRDSAGPRRADARTHTMRFIETVARARRERRLARNRCSARARRRRERILILELERRFMQLTKQNNELRQINKQMKRQLGISSLDSDATRNDVATPSHKNLTSASSIPYGDDTKGTNDTGAKMKTPPEKMGFKTSDSQQFQPHNQKISKELLLSTAVGSTQSTMIDFDSFRSVRVPNSAGRGYSASLVSPQLFSSSTAGQQEILKGGFLSSSCQIMDGGAATDLFEASLVNPTLGHFFLGAYQTADLRRQQLQQVNVLEPLWTKMSEGSLREAPVMNRLSRSN